MENSDEESDMEEEEGEKPKTFAQEMQELKDEVMRGIHEEEYPMNYNITIILTFKFIVISTIPIITTHLNSFIPRSKSTHQKMKMIPMKISLPNVQVTRVKTMLSCSMTM